MADEEEQDCCPLCMEELDITDKTFDACPCGYQVCLWCWHQIKNEYNGLCPACRTPYSEISKQKNTLDREDVVRRTKQRKQKEKNDRRNAAQSTKQTVNRKSLANVRVMQRNLVYAIGLPQTFADEDTLRSAACFGQYGKIIKAVVNKSHLSADRSNATASAYITFSNKEDALACIIAIDGYYLDGSLLRASFGTTKYCNFFLRNLVCNNPDCLYLHELGESDDSFTKEEMQSALHSGKAAFRESTMNGGMPEARAGSEFPPPYRPQAAASSSAPSSGASSEQHADAQRKAQSAAAIYKLKQSAHRSDSSTSSPGSAASSSTATTTISEPFSKIVAGGSAARAPSPELTMAEKLMESNSRTHSAPQLLPSPVPKSDDVTRKPNLHVDTSSSTARERDSTASDVVPEEAASVIVGPLEALKLATGGSSSQEPAWAQPFPSASVVLHSEEDRDDALNLHRHHNPVHAASGSVFSPFGLGFDGGIHRSSGRTATQEPDHVWGVASAFKNNNHENDPLGTNSGSMSNGSAHNSSSVFASPPPPPLPMQQPSAGGASSSLSFASIDAIFSHRTESSDALAGLLGVQLNSSVSVSTPLSHGTPQAKTPANNGRSSRFAFANQPSGLEIPSSPAAPQHHQHHHNGGGIPSSPFGHSSGGSMMDSQRRAPSPFGYGAAVGGLGSSSSFPMHQDTSAFPPLGSHTLHQQQQQQLHHVAGPSPFGSSSGGFGGDMGMLNNSGNDGVGMGSGLAFLQQMLPNVNISFGGDYPSHNDAGSASNGGGLFPEMGGSSVGSNGPQPPLPPSAWNSGNLSSLGFDSSSGSSRLAAANMTASGFYDPAIATLAPPPSSGDSGFFGLGSGSSMDEREHHHLHSALGGAVYRHPGSILNNGN
jgi:CCR4-NOT transcription complex subunit 4